MARFKIIGGQELKGRVEVSGAKNQALKLISYAILLNKKCKIRNVPDILDIRNQMKIASSLNLYLDYKDNVLNITPRELKPEDFDAKTVELLRSSIVFWGPLLARFGRVKSRYPGGCVIGARSINTHLDAFIQAGANVKGSKRDVYLEIKKPQNSNIALKEQSVSATENILLYSAAVNCVTRIENIAIEPEIIDLIAIVNRSGAKINWIGERQIEVTGNPELAIPEIEVIPDRIEAATYALAFIATAGEGEIHPFIQEHNEAFLTLIQECAVNFKISDNTLQIKKSPNLHPFSVKTAPFPGFPTDLQSPISLLAAKANGCSQIHETMFENRFGHLKELSKMGLKYDLVSSRQAKVCGPTEFSATNIKSPDLRSGITLLIAALAAKGTTTISRAEIIDRGYERVEEKLSKIGANIKRIS